MSEEKESEWLNDCRNNLVASYLYHYRRNGYREVESLPVTSKEDDSVIFIGAAVSALKKDYILPQKIPDGGLVIAQPSVRTRNIKSMLDDNVQPKWGSFFTNIDTVCPYAQKEEAFNQVLDFFYNRARINPDDLVLRVRSQDEELFQLIKDRNCREVEVDANPEKYYRHTVGIDGIYGENFNFAVRHKYTRQYSDVGNFIIFRDKQSKKPLFIEVGFGDTVIIQAKYGLNHVMDCYPFARHPALDKNYKFKDCIITSQAMMREGLLPSSRDEQSKILYKYLRAVYYFAKQAQMKEQELAKILYQSEAKIFGDVRAEPKMMRLFAEKKNRIEELNNSTLMSLYKKGYNR